MLLQLQNSSAASLQTCGPPLELVKQSADLKYILQKDASLKIERRQVYRADEELIPSDCFFTTRIWIQPEIKYGYKIYANSIGPQNEINQLLDDNDLAYSLGYFIEGEEPDGWLRLIVRSTKEKFNKKTLTLYITGTSTSEDLSLRPYDNPLISRDFNLNFRRKSEDYNMIVYFSTEEGLKLGKLENLNENCTAKKNLYVCPITVPQEIEGMPKPQVRQIKVHLTATYTAIEERITRRDNIAFFLRVFSILWLIWAFVVLFYINPVDGRISTPVSKTMFVQPSWLLPLLFWPVGVSLAFIVLQNEFIMEILAQTSPISFILNIYPPLYLIMIIVGFGIICYKLYQSHCKNSDSESESMPVGVS